MVRTRRSAVRSWSDLPKELIEIIASFLDTETDILRFRAVCNSWRSCTKPLNKFPSEGIRLPYPFRSSSYSMRTNYFTLVERTAYRLELPGDNTNKPHFWVVKLERRSNGKVRIINPSSHDQIRILSVTQMPRKIDTLNFRVYELCKAYALRYVRRTNRTTNFDEYNHARKVIFLRGIKDDEYTVMAINNDNELWYINSGDRRWKLVHNNSKGNDVYVDLVKLKGQIYGIDLWGRLWEFNSRLEFKKLANGIVFHSVDGSYVTRLEYSNGEFHMIEEMRSSEPCLGSCLRSNLDSVATSGIKVWTLNKLERKWSDAKLLNGRIFFAGEDCSFSVSSKEFDGSNGTRVFYTNECICFLTQEEPMPLLDYCGTCRSIIRMYRSFDTSKDVKRTFRGLKGHTMGVCDFETGKIGSLLLYHEYADIFWPPPLWLFR